MSYITFKQFITDSFNYNSVSTIYNRYHGLVKHYGIDVSHICYFFISHNSCLLFLSKTCKQILNKSNTTGTTSG